jgi:hypothetical protein
MSKMAQRLELHLTAIPISALGFAECPINIGLRPSTIFFVIGSC